MKIVPIMTLFSLLLSPAAYALKCPSVESLNYVMKLSVEEIVQNSLQNQGARIADQWFRLPSNTTLRSDSVGNFGLTCTYSSSIKGVEHSNQIILQFTLIKEIKDIQTP